MTDACFTEFLAGIYTAWTSPMITLFLSDETPLESGPMTKEQVSLMTSLLYIGAILGSFSAGWLANAIGRKWSLIISMISQLIGNSLIIFAKTPLLLFISRIFSGFITGATFVILPIFIAEITQKSLRTTLGNFFGLSCNIGHLVGKGLTTFGFYVVPSISIGSAVIFIGCFLMFPDTPEYLLLRNRSEDAEKSLKFYRGVGKDQPFPVETASEFDDMKKVISLRNPNSKITIKDFKDPTTILAIIITFVMTSNINFTGIRLTTAFTASMLNDAGIPVDVSLTDNIICVLQVVGCMAAIYVIRFFKVRRSFLFFYLASIVSFFGAATHYFLHESGFDMIPYTWSFVTCIVLVVVIPSIAINNLSMSTSSQVLPVKIRGSVLGFLNILGLVVAFFTVQYYLYLVDTIGNSM
uniref:Putative permease of the major facilitator superfamily protein n=1 Tax=Lutzomyia longipalpis TaxID=7200 RepID=A0A1B0CEM6_LUTLO